MYTANDPGHPQDVLMADVHGYPINAIQGQSLDMSDVYGCPNLLQMSAELPNRYP